MVATRLLTIDFYFHSSGRRDSNPRPQPWQGCALPTELLPQFGVSVSVGVTECVCKLLKFK